jgi:hypothetical protein
MGGGGRRGVALIDDFGRWEREQAERREREAWLQQPPAPPVYVHGVHVDASCKSATWSAARLLVLKQEILLPASARDLLAELRLLKLELTPAGVEQIATGGRDLAAAFMLSLQPYRRGSEWRSAAVDAAAWLERRPPVAEVPDALTEMPTVETGAGLRVPRLPAWVGTGGVSLPPGAARADADTAAARREKELQAVRDRVAAAVRHNEQRGVA